MTRAFALVVVLGAAVAVGGACAAEETPTAVRLAVGYEASWQLDRLEVRAGDRVVTTEPSDSLTVLMPEDWTTISIDVFGLHAAARVAHGTAEVTLSAGDTVDAEIELAVLPGPCLDECAGSTCDGLTRIACGQFDDDACLDRAEEDCTPPDACFVPSCAPEGCSITPITCETPPPPGCNGRHIKVTYAPVGTCGAGVCSYVATESRCSHKCVDGECEARD